MDKKRVETYLSELKRLKKQLGNKQIIESLTNQLIGITDRGWLGKDSLNSYRSAAAEIADPKLKIMLIDIFDKYTKTINLVNDLYKDIGEPVTRKIRLISNIEKSGLSDFGDFEQETIDAIAKHARESIIKKESKSELISRFSTLGDKVLAYADTIAGSIISGTGQAAKISKADSAGLTYYTYVGPPINRATGPHQSHVFCIHIWGGIRTFAKSDILKMKNGQKEPVLIHRGGYRCRHIWEPDPFFTPPKNKAVEFISIMGGNREVIIGKWR